MKQLVSESGEVTSFEEFYKSFVESVVIPDGDIPEELSDVYFAYHTDVGLVDDADLLETDNLKRLSNLRRWNITVDCLDLPSANKRCLATSAALFKGIELFQTGESGTVLMVFACEIEKEIAWEMMSIQIASESFSDAIWENQDVFFSSGGRTNQYEVNEFIEVNMGGVTVNFSFLTLSEKSEIVADDENESPVVQLAIFYRVFDQAYDSCDNFRELVELMGSSFETMHTLFMGASLGDHELLEIQ